MVLSTSLGTPFFSLLVTVFTSIAEVFVVCLAGYVLATRGILDKKSQKQINRLNVSLLTPAMLFSKVAFSLSPAKLRELWVVPVFFAVVTAVSMIVAYTLGTLFRLRKSQKSFAMAAAMFMNSNSLPVGLMQSLVVSVPGLKWMPDDTKDAMLGRALTYLMLYSTLGLVLRWSYGVQLLSQADEADVPHKGNGSADGSSMPHSMPTASTSSAFPDRTNTRRDQSERQPIDEHTPLLFSVGHHHYSANANGDGTRPITAPVVDEISPADLPFDIQSSPTAKALTYSISGISSVSDSQSHTLAANSPILYSKNDSNAKLAGTHNYASTRNLSGSSLTSAMADAEFVSPLGHNSTENAHPHLHHQQHHSYSLLHRITLLPSQFLSLIFGIARSMTVPLWAALASIVVACIPDLQAFLETDTLPIRATAKSLGNCAIPMTLLILGAYFHREEEEIVIVDGKVKKVKPECKHKSHRKQSGSKGKAAEPTSPAAKTAPQEAAPPVSAPANLPLVSNPVPHHPPPRPQRRLTRETFGVGPAGLVGTNGPLGPTATHSQSDSETDFNSSSSSSEESDEERRTGRPQRNWKGKKDGSPPSALKTTGSGSVVREGRRDAAQLDDLEAGLGGLPLPVSEVDAGLLNEDQQQQQQQQQHGGETELQRSEARTVLVAVGARMIVTPLLLVPLMALSAKWDVQKVFADPVFVVANVLLMASPPALTLAQITQNAAGDAFERLISKTIFWAYCVVTPPAMMFYTVVGLMLSRL